jgi:hypothetical protein
VVVVVVAAAVVVAVVGGGSSSSTFMLIDVAIPGNRNVIMKGEQILKSKNLIKGMQRIWNVRANVIPVIKGRPKPFQNHPHST